MNLRAHILLFGFLSLTLIFACGKNRQTKETLQTKASASANTRTDNFVSEQEREDKALRIANERVAKLEQELADIEAEQETDPSAVVQQQRNNYRELLKIQIREARKLAEEIGKAVLEAKRNRPSAVTLAKGTHIVVNLTEEVSTDTHKVGSTWEGRLASDLIVRDSAAWIAGTPVKGVVAQSASLYTLDNGSGELSIDLTDIGGTEINGGRLQIIATPSKAITKGRILGGVIGGVGGLLVSLGLVFHDVGISVPLAAAGGAWLGGEIAKLLINDVIAISNTRSITFVAN